MVAVFAVGGEGCVAQALQRLGDLLSNAVAFEVSAPCAQQRAGGEGEMALKIASVCAAACPPNGVWAGLVALLSEVGRGQRALDDRGLH